MNHVGPFLIPIAFAVILWLVLVRPARRQQSRTQEVQRGLDVDARVMLTSGIYGTVRELGEDRVHLEVAPGTVIEVDRRAVASREEPPVSDDDTLDHGAED